MNGLGSYIFSVTAAAIVVALLRPLLGDKGTAAGLGKLLCGIFLLFTVLRPLRSFSLDPDSLSGLYSADAALSVEQGSAAANQALEEIISEQVCAYILEKAAQYDADLTVQVFLSQEELPVPVGVRLEGSISPYGKRQLQSVITEALGISREDQIWI